MVISTNTAAHLQEFAQLLDRAVAILEQDAQQNPSKYISCTATGLESIVFDTLSACATSTIFDGTIELISGQKFPDIVAYNYFGVEVKSTRANKWKSTGSSVAEGTRVDGVERIFMLFAKINAETHFICRPYEECLSEVVVTHSPRYLIDMNLKRGETFFDKINIPYDTLRNLENPIEEIVAFYKSNLQEGETTWWTGAGSSKKSTMVIRLWNRLSRAEQQKVKLTAMCLFPEIFGNSPYKYNRMNLWLASVQSLVVPNVRDIFSAGGQRQIKIDSHTYTLPKIIYSCCIAIEQIECMLNDIDLEEFSEYWQLDDLRSDQIFKQWIDLVDDQLDRLDLDSFTMRDYINSLTPPIDS